MMNKKNNTIAKDVFISDLKKYVGREIQQPFLIKKVTSHTRGNQPSQSIIISDNTGEIEARTYADNIKDEYKGYENNIVVITGMVGNNQNKTSIIISDMRKQESFNMSDYVYMAVKDKEEVLRNELLNYIDMIGDENLLALTKRIFLNNKIFSAISTLPAGLNHHNYCGALLIHTLEVVRLSLATINSFIGLDTLYKVRPYEFNIDKDLVIAAAVLHDIGNYSSFSFFPEQQLTIRGHKLPVSVETISIIDAYNSKLPKDQQCKDMVDLKHIIVAACGDISPMTIEALVVFNANKMAEQLDSFGYTFYQYDKAHPHNEDCIIMSKYLEHEIVRKSATDTRKTDMKNNVDNNKNN